MIDIVDIIDILFFILDNDIFVVFEVEVYVVFDVGYLQWVSDLFGEFSGYVLYVLYLYYMCGLVYKYLCDWFVLLQYNLCVQILQDVFDQVLVWNVGIVVMVLGDWVEVCCQWVKCGINVLDGDGLIDIDFGMICVWFDLWGSGEIVFVWCIDVVCVWVLNVLFGSSGYCLFDIVLYDGVKIGECVLNGGMVFVFNVLQILQVLDYVIFVVFIWCLFVDDMVVLEDVWLFGIGYVEDWSVLVWLLCLCCSYGVLYVWDVLVFYDE